MKVQLHGFFVLVFSEFQDGLIATLSGYTPGTIGHRLGECCVPFPTESMWLILLWFDGLFGR